jgi:hypothetical protein
LTFIGRSKRHGLRHVEGRRKRADEILGCLPGAKPSRALNTGP